MIQANLARLNLPYPEAVFEINFFRENPEPFYTLARELLPGRFRPTLTHSFVKLLSDHGLLQMCFTQNIDTLERMAGVPPQRIIEAHGSFANQHCIDCGAEFDRNTLVKHIKSGTIAHCEKCNGLVKPDIIFFGEALPKEFHKSIPLLHSADLLIVMGTSLTVHPFAALSKMVPEGCPRVLVNLDEVGDFGTRSDDVICLGKTDDIARELCKELGWEDELDAAWKETEESVVDFNSDEPVATKDLSAEDEVKAITDLISKTLHIDDVPQDASEGHRDENNEKPSSSIQVQVNHTESTKPKATYIIGGLDPKGEDAKEEDTKAEGNKDTVSVEDDKKVTDQKL
ncbi:hypothetical protein QCA50_006715 [Cerrena zonata]|uniref:Deacetylase sirtuin-type domain-containing protein n=1 Tax=Cerrena zonata TaxID=2478898 RepID=A0AAW0GKA2_9APHY